MIEARPRDHKMRETSTTIDCLAQAITSSFRNLAPITFGIEPPLANPSANQSLQEVVVLAKKRGTLLDESKRDLNLHTLDDN